MLAKPPEIPWLNWNDWKSGYHSIFYAPQAGFPGSERVLVCLANWETVRGREYPGNPAPVFCLENPSEEPGGLHHAVAE